MYQRRRARVLLAALTLLALVLITVDFRSGEEGPLDRARGLVGAALAPVQEGLTALVRPVGDVVGAVGEIFRVRAENEELRQRLREAESRSRSLTDLEMEVGQLKELLGRARRGDREVMAARTIAFGPSNYKWTTTIDVGSSRGIRRDMVVVDGDGLVGRVIQVGTSSSRVLLAIDPNFSAAARVAGVGEQGQISGRGSDLMQFIPLDPEASVDVGDEIVTSSYDQGVFPPGIPVGAVERVVPHPSLLTTEVLVRPFVDFTRLDWVLVVLNRPASPLPPVPEAPTDAGIPAVPARPSPPAPGGQGPTPEQPTPNPSP